MMASTIILGVLASSALGASTVTNGNTTVSVATDTSVVTEQTRTIVQTVTITTLAKQSHFYLGFKSPEFFRHVQGRRVTDGATLLSKGITSISGPLGLSGSGGGSGEGGRFP